VPPRRRTLAILKYLPAVLCGLLMVAWVVSLFIAPCLMWPWYSHDDNGGLFFMIDRGTLAVMHDPEVRIPFNLTTYNNGSVLIKAELPFGSLGAIKLAWGIREYYVPLSILVTLFAVPAWGCLNSFRFPLWSYFVWTALVAAELAYYLR
jgi:hypothetical protein